MAEFRRLLLLQSTSIASKENPQPPVARKRIFGSAKGQIKMAEDFDAPLDDFKDYQ